MQKRFQQWLSEKPRRRQVLSAILVVAVLILCFAAETTGLTDRLLVWTGVADPHTLPLSGEIQVHTLDVGNADALLVFCDGEAMLIDAGEHGDGDTVTAYLQSYGVTHLTYVIATHADADHIGGMRQVLENFTVGEYLMATMPQGAEPTTATYLSLMSYLSEQRITVTEATVGTVRMLGEAEVSVLAPTFASDESNERSVVCLVTYRNNRFLFMGDAGLTVETALLAKNVRADFLKVGHHGADDATGESFLSRVSPSVAVISCGADNPYGHPTSAVLTRLRHCGAVVYRTDQNGCIVTVGDGKTLFVTTEKE